MDNIEIEKEIVAEKRSIFYLRAFLFVSMMAITVCFTAFYYNSNKHAGRQMVEASVFDARLQNIENSIVQHEKRIAKLEEEIEKLAPVKVQSPAASQTTTPATAPTGDLVARIAALEKEITTLKATPAPQNQEQVAKAITLLTAFHRLGDNMLSGKPFASELSAFQDNYGSDDKSLNDIYASITPYAAGGIPTVYRLLSSFDKARDSLKTSAQAPSGNAGFTSRLLFNLSQMVTIHRIGKTQSSNTVDAILDRAETDLDNEEIEAAIAEIKSLPDDTRSNFSNWLDDAEMASTAPSIVDQIEEKTMKKAFATATVNPPAVSPANGNE